MPITITSATLDDLQAVKELNHQLFQNEIENKYDETLDASWPLGDEGDEYFRSRINNDGGCLFIAKSDGNIVGYLAGGFSHVSRCRNIKGAVAELENMFIEADFRNKGVGAMLAEEFFTWCRNNKCARIRVVASFANSQGIKFYENNGFKPFEVILEKPL